MMLRLALCLAAIMAAAGTVAGQVNTGGSPECRGVFDFYFVLDSSGSTRSALRDQVAPFIEAVANQYVDPNFRLSIMTFATDPVVYLNLTRSGETQLVRDAINEIRRLFGDGMTILAPALELVGEQIRTLGGDTASVVLVLTDGFLTDPAEARQQADFLRSTYGARIYTIGVGNVQRNELGVVADSQQQVYIGDDFDFLATIVNLIIEEICIEITSASPDRICLGSTFEIHLNGSGFTNQLDQSRARCRFKTNNGELIETQPTQPVTDTTFVCPAPEFTDGGRRSLVLQVSTNGVTFVSSSVTLEIDDCMSFNNVQPSSVCQSLVGTTDVTLFGSGFTSSLDQSMAACRFTTSSGEVFMTTPSQPLTNTAVVCPLPESVSSYLGQLTIQVTTDGLIFLEEIGTLEIEDCKIILSVKPQRICNGTATEVEVSGRGFTLDLKADLANCSFTTEDEETYFEFPKLITDDLIICPLPMINYTGVLVLEITTDGEEYFDEKTEISYVICLPGVPKDLTFVAWIFLALIGTALLIGFCLLWLFLPLMTCKIVGGLPPEPKERTPTPPPTPPPPPEPLPPTPGRKWAVVDASYYGGRGAGGIRPMKVKWGDKGATEEGSKLQKTEDAKLITVVEKPGLPAPPPPPAPVVAVVPTIPPKKDPGCWDRFKKKVKRWYAVAASYRPVRGPTKRILWFPGPKGIKKAQATPIVNGGSTNGSAPSGVRNGSSRPPLPSVSNRAPPPPPPFSGSRRAPPKPPVMTTPSRENLLA